MGSIKQAPGKPCCGPGGSGTGSGSGDPLETHYCATHHASDWDGVELGDLLVDLTWVSTGTRPNEKTWCHELTGLYSLTYDLAEVERMACVPGSECILHAWQFFADGIASTWGGEWAVGMNAYVFATTASNCAFRLCYRALQINTATGQPWILGGRYQGVMGTALYSSPSFGDPIDLSTAPGPPLGVVTPGVSCEHEIAQHYTLTLPITDDICRFDVPIGDYRGGVFDVEAWLA